MYEAMLTLPSVRHEEENNPVSKALFTLRKALFTVRDSLSRSFGCSRLRPGWRREHLHFFLHHVNSCRFQPTLFLCQPVVMERMQCPLRPQNL